MQSMTLKSHLNKTMEWWARNCTYKDGEDRISTFISNQSSKRRENFRNPFTPPSQIEKKKSINELQWNFLFERKLSIEVAVCRV